MHAVVLNNGNLGILGIRSLIKKATNGKLSDEEITMVKHHIDASKIRTTKLQGKIRRIDTILASINPFKKMTLGEAKSRPSHLQDLHDHKNRLLKAVEDEADQQKVLKTLC